MAIRPDYNIGTVTLVASSANFTTTGASLQTAAVQAGDAIITPSGHVLIIASVTGQNSGTLFLPCPAGAAGVNLPLRIRFQPDGSRYQGAVRNLVDLLSSGNVEAFAALTGAAGKVPVFTGPGAMDLQDYIADPNGSLGKLAALTLAANKIIRTNTAGNASQGDITNAAAALLALAGAANKLPFFDGANSAALTDLTAFARTILATASGAAMWTALGGTQSLSSNGWVKFPNGFIIQWGRNYAADGDRAITFPIAFPTRAAAKFAVAELTYTPTSTRVTTIDSADNLNSISVRIRSVANGGTVSVPADATITWFALGY